MAIVEGGALGTYKNSIGPVTFFKWRNLNVARARVKPANPRTPAQQANRGVLGTIGSVGSLILTTIVQKYWNPFSGDIPGWSLFIKINRLEQGDEFDPALLITASGSLEKVQAVTASLDGGDVNITWDGTILGNGSTTDQLVAMIYDEVNDVAFVIDDETNRSTNAATVEVGDGRTAADLKCYLFFYQGSGSGMKVSNSQFAQVAPV